MQILKSKVHSSFFTFDPLRKIPLDISLSCLGEMGNIVFDYFWRNEYYVKLNKYKDRFHWFMEEIIREA